LINDYPSSSGTVTINEHILKLKSENLLHIDDRTARNSGVLKVRTVAGQAAARPTIDGE
jgi:hypothetical protein